MKFNLKTLLTAPAALLMLSTVGTGAVSANQVNVHANRPTTNRPASNLSTTSISNMQNRINSTKPILPQHYVHTVQNTANLKSQLQKAATQKGHVVIYIEGQLNGRYQSGQKDQDGRYIMNVPSNVTLQGVGNNELKNIHLNAEGPLLSLGVHYRDAEVDGNGHDAVSDFESSQFNIPTSQFSQLQRKNGANDAKYSSQPQTNSNSQSGSAGRHVARHVVRPNSGTAGNSGTASNVKKSAGTNKSASPASSASNVKKSDGNRANHSAATNSQPGKAGSSNGKTVTKNKKAANNKYGFKFNNKGQRKNILAHMTHAQRVNRINRIKHDAIVHKADTIKYQRAHQHHLRDVARYNHQRAVHEQNVRRYQQRHAHRK